VRSSWTADVAVSAYVLGLKSFPRHGEQLVFAVSESTAQHQALPSKIAVE